MPKQNTISIRFDDRIMSHIHGPCRTASHLGRYETDRALDDPRSLVR